MTPMTWRQIFQELSAEGLLDQQAVFVHTDDDYQDYFVATAVNIHAQGYGRLVVESGGCFVDLAYP